MKLSPERLLMLGLVVAACSGCATGSGKPTALPMSDDFSNCSKGWSTDADAFISLSCTDGAYRFLVKDPALPQNARIFFSAGVATISVEADATRRAGPRTVSDTEFLVYGVGCWKSQTQGYLFIIAPDGSWGIEKVTNGQAPMPWTTLAESPRAHAIPGLMGTNRIRGVCIGGGSKPTTLALYVNGKRVAHATDQAGFDAFPGFGFFVLTSKRGTDIRFDNLAARELSDAEVRSLRLAVQPRRKPPTASSSTSHPSGLCKEAGIRYTGMTAQGAKVCFTLTQDGHALVESAWSFVVASGCPHASEGTSYSTYPGPVDAAGHFNNPDGFTGTIHGATASGVFHDSDICPGKVFKWTARRQS